MPRFWIFKTVCVAVMVSANCPAASIYDDSFSGPSAGPQWTPLNEGGLTLSQSADHLNLLSSGAGLSIDDALYLSKFRLSTAANFSISIKYVLDGPATNGSNNDRLGLTFGVGRDLPDGTNSAAIGVGYGNVFGNVLTAGTVAYRTGTVNNEVETTLGTEAFTPLTGTLNVSYDAIIDRLTFTRVGSTFTYSLPNGTVRGTGANQWGATELVVAFGGRGSGMAATAGDLYLDDFSVGSGVVTPEPTGLAALGALTTLGLRRRRVSRC